MKIKHNWCAGSSLALMLLLTAGPVLAQSAAPAAASATAQPDAAVLLDRMANYVAKLSTFQVTLASSYDAVQEDGQKIEYNEFRKINVRRPDQLRLEERVRTGESDLLLFDGKTVTVFDKDNQVYAQAPQPGSIDDTIVYFVRDLGMRMPLAALFSTRFPAELKRRAKEISYVEATTVLGAPAHHIAARGDGVDVQFWIAEGDSPVPLRIVITYKNESGEPQFRAQFADWQVTPTADAPSYSFVPPTDAKRILFSAQLTRAAADTADKPSAAKSVVEKK